MAVIGYGVVGIRHRVGRWFIMKTHYCDQPYEILRLQDGEWVWCGYGDSRDEGKVTLPEEVYDRLAQGRPGKFEVRGQRYWIKLLAVLTNFT